jgi:hypothetical protein
MSDKIGERFFGIKVDLTLRVDSYFWNLTDETEVEFILNCITKGKLSLYCEQLGDELSDDITINDVKFLGEVSDGKI